MARKGKDKKEDGVAKVGGERNCMVDDGWDVYGW